MSEYTAFIAAGCTTVADKKRWDAAIAFEREACAKVCELMKEDDDWTREFGEVLADAIRARSDKEK